MGVMAPPDQQSKLIAAAAKASVPWVLPNEFGGDGLNIEAGKDIFLGASKQVFRDQIEKLGVSSWIGICCGFWYEFSLGGGPFRYGFDIKNKTATFYDDGETRINTSTWPQTGRAVAKLLALKVLPEDGNDTSTTLQNYKNHFTYVSSFTINQREMFESILRVTGDSASDWKIEKVPAKQVYEDGVAMMKGGNRAGFAKLLYSRSFYPDKFGLTEETRGLDNEKLGLPKEDLDEFTKIGVDLATSGYFAHEGA